MKKLNITKECFEKSRYFQNKYGKLEYVSESGKLFKTNKGKILTFNEAVHPHETDVNVPVTEQEKLLCKYIPDEIEEFCAKNGLDVTCGCSWHNPGEEQHIEIFVGIPEDEDNTDPKYDNIEVNLETLVNGIGDAENEGEKWGDASFQWISDNELFGELWPLNEGEVKESLDVSKNFNEGGKMGKQALTADEVTVVDYLCEQFKLNDFEYRETKNGLGYFYDGEAKCKYSFREGMDMLCSGCSKTYDWATEFGLSKREREVWNGMIDRLGLDEDYKASDFKGKEKKPLFKSKYRL